MRVAPRALLLVALTSVPSLVLAQSPIQLAWRACGGVPTSTATETFSCNTNTTSGGDPITFRLVGSFTPTSAMPDFGGIAAVVEVITPDPVLPNWWQLGSGECRDGSLVASIGYGALGLCANPFAAGQPIAVNLAWVTGYGSPNRARLFVDVACAAGAPIAAGVRYTAFDLRLNAAHAIDDGDPMCGGCCTPACLVLGSVQLLGANGPGETLLASGQESVAGWNGQAIAGAPVFCTVVGGCPTPGAARTWGAIKSLYR